MNKLLIYIVSFQRKEYTQGNIMSITKIKPPNSQIIVCDNGSTDGTREWLEENQEKYELGLIFPEENLRVGGAWTLLTNYFKEDEFDYILLLDNDLWIHPEEGWFNMCLELFEGIRDVGSLGLINWNKPGYYSKETHFDNGYNNRVKFNTIEYFPTVYYAAGRLDRFKLWHQTMKKWPHKFIGDKIGLHYNSLGFKTLKIEPGILTDISEFNFDNDNHKEYNINFHKKERTIDEYNKRKIIHKTNYQVITDRFGEELTNLLK